ncbi:MAG TPA: hypothetical protein VGI00_25055 [Streptosporangiaceae bacterium]|jgi:hypothetical protein
MADPRAARLVGTVLRCYPARWRRRHGEEAAELAALLIGDGTPAVSIAGSYLAGAVREWLTPRPGRRLTAAACALLVAACSVGVSTGLLASAAPARAASTAQAHRTSASQVRGRAPCRPGSPGSVPGVTPAQAVTPGVTSALSRSQLIIWAASHGRSC